MSQPQTTALLKKDTSTHHVKHYLHQNMNIYYKYLNSMNLISSTNREHENGKEQSRNEIIKKEKK